MKIDPPSLNSGNAFWTVNSVPRVFRPNVASKCCSVISPSGAASPMPALAYRTSILPFSRLTVSNRRSRSSRLAASPRTPVTFRPINLTASSSASCLRPVMKTWAPSSTNRLALASAMPLDPPVMTATLFSSFPIITPFGRCVAFSQYSRVDSLAVDENCSGVLIFCLFVQKSEAKLDPITDIFRTMHVTAFGQHRLEATAPWGLIQDKQTEEKVTPANKKISPTDLAHFAMLSRGNCWLSVEGIPEPIPLTGGDCILLARGTSIILRDSPRTRPRWSFREIAARANSNVAHCGGGGAPTTIVW